MQEEEGSNVWEGGGVGGAMMMMQMDNTEQMCRAFLLMRQTKAYFFPFLFLLVLVVLFFLYHDALLAGLTVCLPQHTHRQTVLNEIAGSRTDLTQTKRFVAVNTETSPRTNS